MSIDLPSQVVWFLNLIGVNWPDVDEDQVRAFAGHVRDFGNNIDNTHQAASSTVQQMGESYTGQSYEQLVSTWARMSNDHMSELVSACGVVATALDVAADTIVAAKVAAIGELVALAASFMADQAAAFLTFGAAEAAEALVVTAAKKCVNALIQQLEQHIMGEVIQAAIAPLEAVVERALGGLVFKGLDAALGDPSVGGGGAGVGREFSISPSALAGHANTLHGHADEVAAHATTFANAASGVSFGG
jgi:uncharacterized protein YukE